MTAPNDEPHDRRQPDAHSGDADAAEIAELEAEVDANLTDRVITFSDAVVAIAITLLALDLPVPGGFHGITDGRFLRELGNDWPRYLSFLISFAVIGNHWVTHRTITRYVCKWNPRVGQLNMIWLLMMILTPVGAKLLAGTGAFGIRFGIYALIQVIATGTLMFMKLEFSREHLLRPGAPASARHPDLVPYIAFIVAFGISIPIAFVSAWAYALWAAVPLVGRAIHRIMGSTDAPRHSSLRS